MLIPVCATKLPTAYDNTTAGMLISDLKSRIPDHYHHPTQMTILVAADLPH